MFSVERFKKAVGFVVGEATEDLVKGFWEAGRHAGQGKLKQAHHIAYLIYRAVRMSGGK